MASTAQPNPAGPAPANAAARPIGRGFRFRGFVGGFFLGPALVCTLLSQPMVPRGSGLDLLCDAVAWVLFIAGVVFRIWPTLYIGGRKRFSLVTEGPYSICRNPLYFGSFLLGLSAACFLKSPFFASLLIVVAVWYTLKTLPEEEKDLAQIIGPDYTEYCRTVPRFFPRFSQFRSSDNVSLRVHGLHTEALRAVVWIWIPLAGEVISFLRAESWWPHVFRHL